MSDTKQLHSSYEKAYDIISAGLKIDRDKILPQSRFIDDLGADSLDLVELVMALEEEFELSISDEESEKFISVQDVFHYIDTHKIIN